MLIKNLCGLKIVSLQHLLFLSLDFIQLSIVKIEIRSSSSTKKKVNEKAVEASRCYFFEKWLMKHKWATLVTMQPEIYHQNSQSFYPPEPFTLDHITMRHPVLVPYATLIREYSLH